MSTNDSPILRLRGGGASGLRKEARKRKFAQLGQKSHQSREGAALEEGRKKPERPSKISRREEPVPEQKVEHASTEMSQQEPSTTELPAQDITSKKAPRFIVFIGNLPFSATTNSIRQHFAKVKPSSIRHSTSKDTGKSKGFAFLEFDEYNRMQTCLKLYHHSSFEDGESTPRRLNVELTYAGGGGHSRARRIKLQSKNEKLHEERKRRAEKKEVVSTKTDQPVSII